jgi:UPF0716 family protein affecting phage T7 exclusion
MTCAKQYLCCVAALLMVVPGVWSTVIGLALTTPTLVRHWLAHKNLKLVSAA